MHIPTHEQKPGYVIILALLIIAGMAALATRVISKVLARYQQSVVFQDRAQARQLALSGLQIAQSMLTPEKKEKGEQKPIARQLEYINTWHKFVLQEKKDGIDGKIMLYITNQSGKIPLNSLFDFKKKKYKDGAQKIIKKCDALIKKNIKNSEQSELDDVNLEQAIKKLFQKYKKPLESSTQLMENKKYAPLQDYLFPSPDKKISLLDILATESDCEKINPLMLTPSVQEMLGIQSKLLKKIDLKQKKDLIQKITKNIPEQVAWNNDWAKYAQPLYKKPIQQIPQDVQKLFDNKIGADVFSVVCYGSVGSDSTATTTQKVYAVLKKGEKRIGNKKNQVAYTIRKLYWL